MRQHRRQNLQKIARCIPISAPPLSSAPCAVLICEQLHAQLAAASAIRKLEPALFWISTLLCAPHTVTYGVVSSTTSSQSLVLCSSAPPISLAPSSTLKIASLIKKSVTSWTGSLFSPSERIFAALFWSKSWSCRFLCLIFVFASTYRYRQEATELIPFTSIQPTSSKNRECN